MAGLFAKGTGLWKGTSGSPGSMKKIANVKSITGPQFAVTVVDTTTHSTAGNFREKTAVLVDSGTLQFNVNYDPSDPTLAPSTGLFNDMQDLTEGYYELRLSPANVGNQKMAFNGFVTGHSFTFPVDNVQDAQITITLDGAVTWS